MNPGSPRNSQTSLAQGRMYLIHCTTLTPPEVRLPGLTTLRSDIVDYGQTIGSRTDDSPIIWHPLLHNHVTIQGVWAVKMLERPRCETTREALALGSDCL
jgi:hypothetical protein